jgi:hypothetical protein
VRQQQLHDSDSRVTELDLRQSPWNEGLGISTDFLDRELYLLACIVNASPALDELGDERLCTLRQQFQEVEIGRILLTVAVTIRNAMDQNPARAAYWLKDMQDEVGTLAREEKDEARLSFRGGVQQDCSRPFHQLRLRIGATAAGYGDRSSGSSVWRAGRS